MADPNEELRQKADALDISGMAADFADVAQRLEFTGVTTAEDLREFVERNPEALGSARDHLAVLFGDRLM